MALRAGINFEMDIAAGGFGGNQIEIERERFAMQQNAAGGMPSTRRCGFQARASIRSVISMLQIHVAVDTADDEIELRQRVVFQSIDPSRRMSHSGANMRSPNPD